MDSSAWAITAGVLFILVLLASCCCLYFCCRGLIVTCCPNRVAIISVTPVMQRNVPYSQFATQHSLQHDYKAQGAV